MADAQKKGGLRRVEWLSLVVALVCLALSFERLQAQQIPGDISTRPAKTHTPQPKPASDPDSSGTSLQTSLARIHVQSNLVIAPVTVIDRAGNFVDDLGESDFRVLDNGVPQAITQFQLAVQPVALVIVIQTNESVAPLLGQVRPVGSEFSGLLVGQKGVAAVLSFADRVHVLQNFSNDPAALRKTMGSLAANGSKARLNDALARAILMLSERPSNERRVIMVFSEGYDRGSETSRQQIIQAASDAGVAIYGLRFDPTEILLERKDSPSQPSTLYNAMALPGVPGQPHTPASTRTAQTPPYLSPLDLAGKTLTAARSARPKARSLVWQYAALTGGVAYSHWGRAGLQNQIQQIALEINSQYILAYVPSTLKQIGFHRLQVEVTEPSLKTRARAGYFYGVSTRVPTKVPPKIKPKKRE